MISIKEIRIKEEFENLKLKDKILVEYTDDRMYLLDVKRIENNCIIGKMDFNSCQEVCINIESLVNGYLGNHIKRVLQLIN